ncbi:MAG: hypothetical protein KME16_15990 [Scytolyngbya sp. HA4215-MV1]|jgi:hypothetical protein|nr:hypothetical protein [Scytolyngbya sp. HA4215-MV1]
MNTIREQFTKLWQLLSNSETGTNYQKTLGNTWQILRETLKLAWLILCFGLVMLAWLWNVAIQGGQSLRSWLNGIEEPTANRVLSEAGKVLLTAGQTTTTSLVSQARSQLGIPEPVEVKAVPVSEPKKQIAGNPVVPVVDPKPIPTPIAEPTAIDEESPTA